MKSVPVFKHRIWGGQRLREVLGKELPAGEKIGESWEVADLPEGQSTIANGPFAGQALGDVVRRYTREIMGTEEVGRGSVSRAFSPRIEGGTPVTQRGQDALDRGPERFPLLIKFLDAEDVLSVQVHPDPESCRRMGRGDPKTECWYVIHAEPGAVIYKGLRKGVSREQFAKAIGDGTVAELLAAVPVSRGECHFIPAGTAHSIGAGLLIAEIQTPSDTTYRVFDWNRVDQATGKPRPLHIEEALESIHFDITPDKLPVTTVGRLVDSPHFKIDKGDQVKTEQWLLKRGRMRTLICLTGAATILSGQAEPVDFKAGDCLLTPAAYEGVVMFAEDTEYLTVML